jgi:UPF0755 protein
MKVARPGYAGILIVVGLLIAFQLAVLAYGEFTTAVVAEPPFVLEVRPGESFSQVARRLAAEHALRHPAWFHLFAVLRGDTGRIRAGDYALTGRVSPGALLDDLVSGKGAFAAITVPEGIALKEIAQRVEELGLGNAAEFLRLAHDAAFIATLNLPFQPRQPSLEGFIFPETYFIHRAAGEAALLATMVRQFKKRAGSLLVERAASVRMTPYDALILASIVEKETGVEAERPLVSAVFHNRLKSRIRLGSDPTVIYGIADFNGNLTRAHLKAPGPYNTYVNFGLPPTPITSPGFASLQAVVDPAKVDYLYFVSKGDGTHFFSKDYETHEKAVDRYQRRPQKRRRT